ncbi:methyl-accepting chemotaxis protein [Bradyrhizobium sp. GM24.11]
MRKVAIAIRWISLMPRGFRIGLREQLALLGIAGVIVTGAICALTVLYGSVAQREANASNEFKDQVLSLSQTFLGSGQIATEFERRPSEESIRKHADNHERQLAALGRVEKFVADLSADNPMNEANSLRSVINLYATRFQNVVSAQRNLGFSENEGFQGKLRKAVRALENRVSELNQPHLALFMLKMRRHENEFMLRGEEKDGDQLVDCEAEFETALAQSNLSAEEKSSSLSLIRAYKADFLSFMITKQTLRDQVDDLEQIYSRIHPTLMRIVAAADAKAHLAGVRADHIQRKSIWIIVLGTAFVGLLALLFGQRIARTVASMTAAMRRLGEGRFDVVLPGLGRKDELGDMAEAIEMFKLRASERAQTDLAERAEQDRAVANQRRADIARLAAKFEEAVGHVIDTVSSASTQLEASARSLTYSADQSQKLSVEVAASSEEASANVQHVSVATSEMSATITEVGRQVEEASTMARQAVRKAELSDQRMATLAVAAERIGSVVQLIAAIARQSNLLALNATIEAARAGDLGRGFAIVAQEVKSLAAETARATVEISEQVDDIQAATSEAVGEITEIGVIITRISEIAMAAVASIEEQKATGRGIALNLQKAAAKTVQVASSAGAVTNRARETGGASVQVLKSAELLSGESSRLKHQLDRFLSGVQAA